MSSCMTHKALIVQVTAEMIEGAERDSTGRCMVAEALKAIPGITKPAVDMQTIRFTRDGQREVYYSPWDVQNAIVRFDGGDQIDPFVFRLVYRNRLLLQRQIMEQDSKPLHAAKARARYHERRVAQLAHDVDATPKAKRKAKAKLNDARADVKRLAATNGPVRVRRDQPTRGPEVDDMGVRPRVRTVRYPNLGRQRRFGQRIMRANQPDARLDRGFTA